jgi:hypothetical protein
MLRPVLIALLCLLPSLKATAAPTPYLNAQLTSGGTVPGTVFLRGTQARIQAGISRCLNTVPGCPSSFARSSMYFLLPPGLTYDHHTASNPMNPATCTATAAPGGGQYVACTGGAVTGGSYSSAQLLLYVNVAVDAPLGAIRLVMAVDEDLPANSVTLAECLDDLFPNYCDDYTSSIGAAPAPVLLFQNPVFYPAVLEPDHPSSIVLFARNNGNAPSTATHLQTSLPPGFQWLPANTSTVGPTLTCTAAGTWNTGQTVTCSGAGLPATTSGTVQLTLGVRPRIGMETPGPLPVVASINEGASPDPAVLLACAADPSPQHCAWLDVPTHVPCAFGFADGIFCNGFDPLQPVLIHPARELQTD